MERVMEGQAASYGRDAERRGEVPTRSVGTRSEGGKECQDGLAGEKLFRAAAESIRANSKTFYFATALLPPAKRLAIRALYAFCRATDDLVDLGKATYTELEAWRRKVKLPAEKQCDPILYAWALTREQYGVNPHYEDELISGVAFDLSPRVYRTWEELETYCYHVASTVGLLSMPIVGLGKGWRFEQAAPYAIRLGIALQLTNILRDIGEDAARGQVYLPEVDLERFGLTRTAILEGVPRRALCRADEVRDRAGAEDIRGGAAGDPPVEPQWAGRSRRGGAALPGDPGRNRSDRLPGPPGSRAHERYQKAGHAAADPAWRLAAEGAPSGRNPALCTLFKRDPTQLGWITRVHSLTELGKIPA